MSMQQPTSPGDVLNEGLTRAKNMAVAFGMICFLLLKFFVVKIVWKRCQGVFAWTVVKTAVGVSTAWARLQPHWEKFKVYAAETKIKVIRLALGSLIVVLTPVENLLLRATGVAKEHSEKIATKTSMTLAQALAAVFNSIGTAFRSGFSRPAVQKMLNRVLELVDEAQK